MKSRSVKMEQGETWRRKVKGGDGTRMVMGERRVVRVRGKMTAVGELYGGEDGTM